MATRTRYAPGTFSWVDLGTTDAAVANSFYAALFGWTYEDMPAGEQGVYSMARRDGDDVAAVYEQRKPGPLAPPPAWLNYVTVTDAARARELGGNLITEPFDVMDAGRMAVVQDPQGAVLALWQARGHIGARRVNEAGCLTWNELATTDPQAAQQFYAGLFGWSFPLATSEPFSYWTIDNAGRSNGGLVALGPGMEDVPPHWRPYFATDSVDGALDTARAGGGRVLVEPVTVPAGRFAAIADPQGALFCLFDGEFDG